MKPEKRARKIGNMSRRRRGGGGGENSARRIQATGRSEA